MADLCTLDHVLVELKLRKDGIDPVETARIGKLIKAVSQAIRTYTGVAFAAASYTETFDGDCRSFSTINKPITAVTEVADVWDSPAIIKSPSSDYAVDLAAGLIFPKRQLTEGSAFWRQAERFEPGRQRYRVTYTAGSDTIPDDIQLAAVRWIVALRNITPGMSSERIGDYSYSVGDISLAEMPADVRLMLSNYRGKRVRIS